MQAEPEIKLKAKGCQSKIQRPKDMADWVRTQLQDTIVVRQQMLKSNHVIEKIQEMVKEAIHCIEQGGKVIWAGNGGSCSDALHLCAELVARYKKDRPALPSVCLGANNSVLTAIGNDYEYADVFSRELLALGKRGDLLIALSTSGNSENILRLVKAAHQIGILTYCLTGHTGGKLSQLATCIHIPSVDTPRIQEAHITIGHIFCELVENHLFFS